MIGPTRSTITARDLDDYVSCNRHPSELHSNAATITTPPAAQSIFRSPLVWVPSHWFGLCETRYSSGVITANAACLVLATIAFNLSRAVGSLAGTDLDKARSGTIRRKLISIPARISTSA